MKWTHFLLASALSACTDGARDQGSTPGSLPAQVDSAQAQGTGTGTSLTSKSGVMYANERFKEVSVERTSEHEFLVRGRAQIFEASFSWVVEDGHDELMRGHEMTDAGASAWGEFQFTIDVPKVRPNSTLVLILFETSAKDGSQQHALPMVLY